MRFFAVNVLLLLMALFAVTTAVPLNIVKDRQTSETLSAESTEQSHDNDSNESDVVEEKERLVDSSFDSVSSVEHLWPVLPSEEESNDSDSVYELHQKPVKRSVEVPDVDLCAGHRGEVPKDITHEEHDEYLRYKYEQDRHRYRRSTEDSSSEEDSSPKNVKNAAQEDSSSSSSSEEDSIKGAAGAPAGENAANAARLRRNVVDDDKISEEKSSEEQAAKGAAKCGCSSSIPEETSHNAVNRANSVRRRRHDEGDKTSEEKSSETNAAQEVAKCGCSGTAPKVSQTVESLVNDAASTRRRRQAIDDSSLSENSFEEKLVKEAEVPKGSENTAETFDITPDKPAGKQNSVEDYVQGCEVLEVNSYEANETTYNEERRRRDAKRTTDANESSDSQDDDNESERKQHKTHETDGKTDMQSDLVASLEEGAKSPPVVEETISAEDASEVFDSSIEQINIRPKRSADESKESNSNSNSNSKEDEKTVGDKKEVAAAVEHKAGEEAKEIAAAAEAKPVEAEAKEVQQIQPEEANPVADSQTAVNQDQQEAA